MFDFENNQIKTCHSKNPVPFALKTYQGKNIFLKEKGELADIAPTVLDLLGVFLQDKKEFSGQSLIQN